MKKSQSLFYKVFFGSLNHKEELRNDKSQSLFYKVFFGSR